MGLFLELFPAQGQNENLAFRLSETQLFEVLGVPVILFLLFVCCFFEGAHGNDFFTLLLQKGAQKVPQKMSNLVFWGVFGVPLGDLGPPGAQGCPGDPKSSKIDPPGGDLGPKTSQNYTKIDPKLGPNGPERLATRNTRLADPAGSCNMWRGGIRLACSINSVAQIPSTTNQI